MKTDEPPSTDPRVAVILDTLTRLVAGDRGARAAHASHMAGEGRGDALDRIIEQLNRLAGDLAARHAVAIEEERRLEEILEVVSGMVALDFTKKAWVGEAGSVIDATAFGLNMLSEELAASMVSRAYVDNILQSMIDALLVVSPDGVIKTVNRTAIKLFGYAREEICGRRADILFERARGFWGGARRDPAAGGVSRGGDVVPGGGRSSFSGGGIGLGHV